MSGPLHAEAVIRTARTFLRKFTHDDLDAMREVFADPLARRWYPLAAGPDFVERWIARNLERYAQHGFGLWALCLRDSGALIGDCGLSWQPLDHGEEMEIGYHLAAVHRGHGYVTEAGRACLDHGFRTLDCARIVSIVKPGNTSSMAVGARVHASHERTLKRGEPRELYVTTRAQWEAGHARGAADHR